MGDRAIRSRKLRASPILFVLALAACGGAADSPAINTIRVELSFGGGVTLTSVIYTLDGKDDWHREGTLPVGDSSTVTATFQNLPPGQPYRIRVLGTASDNVTMCRGELMFSVSPGSMTTTLQIPLECQGLVAVTATFNSCPVIDSLSAIPAEVRVGGAIQLTAEVHDADNGPSPLTAVWQTTGGTLSNLSTTGATFACTAPGFFMVGMKISDGTGNNCPDSSKVTLTCTPGGV